MREYYCAICGEWVQQALICTECHQKGELDSDWAQALMTVEKQWRNMERRDARHGVTVLSDYSVYKDGEMYDGWDVLDGEVEAAGASSFLSAFGTPDNYFSADWALWEESLTEYLLYEIAEAADLTQGELNALLVYLFPPNSLAANSEETAKILSQVEGKTVSADAYRRRKSDALKKLNKLGQRLRQLKPAIRLQRFAFFEDVYNLDDMLLLEELLHLLNSQSE